ncbi:hypothetical protein CRG98_045213 [Punica granatum]|nr:hypothetical protein CRG98_045213 [Punica granatum]
MTGTSGGKRTSGLCECACMQGTFGAHEHKSACGGERRNARGDGRAGARAQTGVQGQTCAGVTKRRDARASDGCTVHPRADPNLKW